MKKILIVDDHNIFREGLLTMLGMLDYIEIVGHASNGRSAISLTRKTNPDMVLMDINMPDLNGIDCAQKLMEEFPNLKIIILSMYSDRQLVVGALRAGVRGYLLKDCDFEELKRAIQTVINDDTFLSPKITDTVVKGYLDKLIQMDDSDLGVLTVREREILQLIAEGHRTQQMADKVHLSAKTIEYHRRNIMDKLDIHNIAELTKFAIREKLTTL